MKDFVQKAREFSRGEYAVALDQGDLLPPAEFDAVAAKLAGFTGLSVEYCKQSKLRVEPARFRKELLRDKGQTLGRYDARFDGTDTDDAGETPDCDPSDTGISGVFVGAFHEYMQTQLKYNADIAYDLRALRRDAQESQPARLLRQRMVRPRHAVLRHRARPGSDDAATVAGRQREVRVLPGRPHGLSSGL
jgi:carboxypeptidase C (cathepsin A)